MMEAFHFHPDAWMCNKEDPGSPMTGLAWSWVTVMDYTLTVEGEGVLFKMDTREQSIILGEYLLWLDFSISPQWLMNMISLIGLIEALLSPLLGRISALGRLSSNQSVRCPVAVRAREEEQTGDIAGTMEQQLLRFYNININSRSCYFGKYIRLNLSSIHPFCGSAMYWTEGWLTSNWWMIAPSLQSTRPARRDPWSTLSSLYRYYVHFFSWYLQELPGHSKCSESVSL